MIAISEDIAKPAPAVTVILQPSDGFSAPSAQLENKNTVNFTAISKSKTWIKSVSSSALFKLKNKRITHIPSNRMNKTKISQIHQGRPAGTAITASGQYKNSSSSLQLEI